MILAYYFGGKQYATDTTEIVNGKLTFSADKELDGGIYLLVLPEGKYLWDPAPDISFSDEEVGVTLPGSAQSLYVNCPSSQSCRLTRIVLPTIRSYRNHHPHPTDCTCGNSGCLPQNHTATEDPE